MTGSFSLSLSRMVDEWKLARCLAPAQPAAAVNCTYGLDIDATIACRLRVRHAELLATAPADMLPLTDIAGEATVSRGDDGAAVVELPGRCLRVVSATMKGWLRAATIETDPHSVRAMAQQSPFARGAAAEPVGVVSGTRLMLYTPPPGSLELTELLAVMLPADSDTLNLTPWLMARLMETEIFNDPKN